MKSKINKLALYVAGFGILILGVTLILSWWPALILVLKGVTGLILALFGLGMLYFVRKL